MQDNFENWGAFSPDLAKARIMRMNNRSVLYPLIYRGRRIDREGAPPRRLQREFAQLLGKLLVRMEMEVEQIYLRPLDAATPVCQIQVVHSDGLNEQTSHAILKCGEKGEIMAECRKWHNWVAPYLPRDKISTLLCEAHTPLLGGALYTFEGNVWGDAKGTIVNAHDALCHGLSPRWFCGEVDNVLQNWGTTTLQKQDLGAYIRSACADRTARIRSFCEEEGDWEPLGLLDLSMEAWVQCGLAQMDCKQQNILVTSQTEVFSQQPKKNICLIDFGRIQRNGFRVASLAQMELSFLLHPTKEWDLRLLDRLFEFGSLDWEANLPSSNAPVIECVRAMREVMTRLARSHLYVGCDMTRPYLVFMAAEALRNVGRLYYGRKLKFNAMKIAGAIARRLRELEAQR